MSHLKILKINGELSIVDFVDFVFQRETFSGLEVAPETFERVKKSQDLLNRIVVDRVPVYGVTTGFGDSCHRVVPPEAVESLQENLVRYLSCGSGEILPVEAVRAMTLIRLNSMARGYSGISPELLARMVQFLNLDLLPQVPCEGSLGASGDLIPLAYYAQLLQGKGQCFYKGRSASTVEVLSTLNIEPYVFKAKEALAIVNGTSTMAGMLAVNLQLAESIFTKLIMASSWQCLALGGRREAFSVFVNEVAKTNPGQSRVAQQLRDLLDAEDYRPTSAKDVKVVGNFTEAFVQDRYSMRCVPQILGPIREQLDIAWVYLKHEINSCTDNPLFTEEGDLELGGNFYGGYLCQAHDILKMNIAHMADLLDRQLAMIIDEKSNRGLPPNLIDTSAMPPHLKHCHQGLKGVHQAVSAITAEILQRSIPNGIFSRSSESHNQDKVSMGMGAAMSCYHQVHAMMRITTMHLVALAQALDLRQTTLQGEKSKVLYGEIRSFVPKITEDTELGPQLHRLNAYFLEKAL